jgi:hypothetical protein
MRMDEKELRNENTAESTTEEVKTLKSHSKQSNTDELETRQSDKKSSKTKRTRR